jgi:hypothetical protein
MKCQCADSRCPAHTGQSRCTREANRMLYRVDMDDVSGTRFCGICADDALESGVFFENPRGRKRAQKNPRGKWGPKSSFRSLGPLQTIAQVKALGKRLKAKGRHAEGDYAIRFPEAVLARPEQQRQLVGLLAMVSGLPNPRGRKKRSRGRRMTAKGRMGRTIKTAPFAKYAQRADAAEAAFRMTPTQRREAQRRRFYGKKNPMRYIKPGREDFHKLRQVDLFTGKVDPVQVRASLGTQAWMKREPGFVRQEIEKALARMTDQQFLYHVLGHRVKDWLAIKPLRGTMKKNPLAIYGVNPPRARTVRELGRVVEIRYKRKDDGQFYKHDFKSRPRLLALSDGTIAVRP